MCKFVEFGVVNSELMSVYNILDFFILVFDMDYCLNCINDVVNRCFYLNNGFFRKFMDILNFFDYFEDIEMCLNKML